MRQLSTMENEVIEEKIIFNFRLMFLKDRFVGSLIDDFSLSQLNHVDYDLSVS